MNVSKQRGRKSGGHFRAPVIKQQPADLHKCYQSVPPEERRELPGGGVPTVVKTIIVHDERGKVVSVTRVAPDAKFGVGVRPNPGHTVKEVEAGDLAADPFGD